MVLNYLAICVPGSHLGYVYQVYKGANRPKTSKNLVEGDLT